MYLGERASYLPKGIVRIVIASVNQSYKTCLLAETKKETYKVPEEQHLLAWKKRWAKENECVVLGVYQGKLL